MSIGLRMILASTIRLDSPTTADYFDLARSWQPWLLLMVFAAFAEEIIFRGVLLPRFIKRYGLHRGIFLTGMAWALFHFRTDTSLRLSGDGVLLRLAYRVLFCLALNYVFAWMTIRWNSVIPAGLAHTVANILVMSGLVSQEGSALGATILLWTILAAVLFHFWPLRVDHENTGEVATADPQSSS